MTEEEKKAIEKFKKKIERADKDIIKFSDVYTTLDIHNLKLLLNLIDKQQKEIKELKEITKTYDSYIGEKMPLNSTIIIADGKYFMNGTFVNKFISKDKIRDKIKDLEEQKKHQEKVGLKYSEAGFFQGKINALNELLEEE